MVSYSLNPVTTKMNLLSVQGQIPAIEEVNYSSVELSC